MRPEAVRLGPDLRAALPHPLGVLRSAGSVTGGLRGWIALDRGPWARTNSSGLSAAPA